jgi:hypothetical protein
MTRAKPRVVKRRRRVNLRRTPKSTESPVEATLTITRSRPRRGRDRRAPTWPPIRRERKHVGAKTSPDAQPRSERATPKRPGRRWDVSGMRATTTAAAQARRGKPEHELRRSGRELNKPAAAASVGKRALPPSTITRRVGGEAPVSAFRPVVSSPPPSEPDVRLPPHPALHEHIEWGSCSIPARAASAGCEVPARERTASVHRRAPSVQSCCVLTGPLRPVDGFPVLLGGA